jgi:hypothetical protein
MHLSTLVLAYFAAVGWAIPTPDAHANAITKRVLTLHTLIYNPEVLTFYSAKLFLQRRYRELLDLPHKLAYGLQSRWHWQYWWQWQRQ